MTTVLLTASKNLNVGMHSDVWEPVWTKLSMMIDTIELYSLILVHLILTFIQGLDLDQYFANHPFTGIGVTVKGAQFAGTIDFWL